MHTPADNQPMTALSPSLAGNVPSTSDTLMADANGSGKPAHVDCDPGTSDPGASLSELDKIGMRVRVTRTARATGVTIEGEQASTSGATATQTASTQQDLPEVLAGTDASGLDILDLDVEVLEDFSDIDLDLPDELLGESPVEMIGNWVTRCNH